MRELIRSIRNPIILYLPARLFPSMKEFHVKSLESYDIINTLIIYDEDGEAKPLTNKVFVLKLLEKPKILRSNIFQLLKYKSILDNSAFKFLLDDYLSEMDTWIATTEVIKTDAKKDTKNYQLEFQEYLYLQYDALIYHKKELKLKFGDWKTQYELDRVAKIFGGPPLDIAQLKKFKNQRNITDEQFKFKKAVEREKSKVKKVTLNQKEVDVYLLEHIFQVDFTKIKKK